MSRSKRRASIKVDPKTLCFNCKVEVGDLGKPCKFELCSEFLCITCHNTTIVGGWKGYCFDCSDSPGDSTHTAPAQELQIGNLHFEAAEEEDNKEEDAPVITTGVFSNEIQSILFEKFLSSAKRAMNIATVQRFRIPVIEESSLKEYFNFVLVNRDSLESGGANFFVPEMTDWTRTEKGNLFRKLTAVIEDYERKQVCLFQLLIVISYLIYC